MRPPQAVQIQSAQPAIAPIQLQTVQQVAAVEPSCQCYHAQQQQQQQQPQPQPTAAVAAPMLLVPFSVPAGIAATAPQPPAAAVQPLQTVQVNGGHTHCTPNNNATATKVK